jgi:hypothetical protein
MKALTLAAFIGISLAPAVNAATLEATYEFNHNLNADQAGVPALTPADPLGSNTFMSDTVFGQTHEVYRWVGNANPTSQQAGFSLNTTGLITSNSYSVVMVFSFDSTSGWRRIIDVSDRQSDSGFYVDPSSHLDVFPVSGSGPNSFTSGYHNVVLTVASDGTVKGYIDGLTDFTTNTTVMNTTNSATDTMNFFLDNVVAGGQGEFSDGDIAQLQLYDGVLTDAEALQISQVPLLPEPTGITLLGLAIVTLAGRREFGRRFAMRS